jgi:hypothetical protein
MGNPFVPLNNNIGRIVYFSTIVISAVTGSYTSNANALAILPKGKWLLFPTLIGGGTTSQTSNQIFISDNSNNDATGLLGVGSATVNAVTLGVTEQLSGITDPVFFDKNTPIYAKARTGGANNTVTISGFAVQIG